MAPDGARTPRTPRTPTRRPPIRVVSYASTPSTHLTAASVEGLKEANVSIVDSKGNTLSAAGGAATGSAAKQASDYESRTRSSVQAMLDQLLGPGNSTVTVSADVSASTGKRTSKTYSVPSKSPVLSESTDSSAYKGSGAAAAAGSMGGDTTSGTTTTSGSGDTYVSKKAVKKSGVPIDQELSPTISPMPMTTAPVRDGARGDIVPPCPLV